MKDALRRLGFCTRSTRPSFVSFGRCIKVGTMFAKCVTTRFLNLVCQVQKDTDSSEKLVLSFNLFKLQNSAAATCKQIKCEAGHTWWTSSRAGRHICIEKSFMRDNRGTKK